MLLKKDLSVVDAPSPRDEGSCLYKHNVGEVRATATDCIEKEVHT
jgi:hypothetical protein